MPRLGEIMRPEPIVVAPEDTLGEVAERMTAANVGAVIVKDYGRMIGILTERDLLKAMAARVHTSEARVRQWMTEDPLTASADADTEEAAQIMLEHKISGLPVVDGVGKLVGIITESDIFRLVVRAWSKATEAG
jgi:acetoin utilization protein AcuB